MFAIRTFYLSPRSCSQDLPGLVGGHSGDLSLLVSEAVSYTDPAFPNMEFHRRSAMDKAGYFMPGYKLKASSPVYSRSIGSRLASPLLHMVIAVQSHTVFGHHVLLWVVHPCLRHISVHTRLVN